MSPRAPDWAGGVSILVTSQALTFPCAQAPLCVLCSKVSRHQATRGAAATWPASSKHPIVQPGHPQFDCKRVHIFLASITNTCECAMLSIVRRYGPESVAVDSVQSAANLLSRTPTRSSALGLAVPPRLKAEAYQTCRLGSFAHPGARGDCASESGFQPGLDEVVE